MDMLTETKALIKAHKGPRLEMAANAGVKFDWLNKFIGGKISDPGISKIQRLHDYLKKSA